MSGLTRHTASLKPADVEKRWIVIDAENAVVGRLASFIAMRLRGKHRPDYTPHVDCGDFVVVVNADKVKFTGKKLHQKTYYWHTGHPGGVKSRTADQILAGKYPERVLEKAIERMLPKESPLARKQMTHLRIYTSAEHPHEAQRPEVILFAELNSKNECRGRAARKRRWAHAISNRLPVATVGPETPAGEDPSGIDVELSQDFGRVTADLDRLLLNLDDNEQSEARAEALSAIAEILRHLDLEAGLHDATLRRVLRTVPDRLLLALSENLDAEKAARAAAVAMVVAMFPQRYREEDALSDEVSLLQDFEALLEKYRIDSFVTLDLDERSQSSVKVDSRLWTSLPFKFAGQRPRLAKAAWLTSKGSLGLEVSGADTVKVEPVPTKELRQGQLAGVRATLRPDAKSATGKVVVYLKHNEAIFDRQIYSATQLFPEAERLTA